MFVSLNVSYFHNLGFVLLIFLVIQIILGLLLSCYFILNSDPFRGLWRLYYNNFGSWFIIIAHCVLANVIFFLIFVHIYKAFRFSAYNLVWVKVLGFIIFMLYAATCFTGYLLPHGQMSFWGGVVILSLLGVLPYSKVFLPFIFGDFGYSFITLRRFYVAHFLLPFVLLVFVFAHIALLHLHVGSSNLPVKPYLTTRIDSFTIWNDLQLFLIISLVVILIITFKPFMFYEATNFVPANPLSTPPHIVPEWYFIGFYGVLKCFSNKTTGIYFFLFSLVSVLLAIQGLSGPFLCNGRKSVHSAFITTSHLHIILIAIVFMWVSTLTYTYPYSQLADLTLILWFLLLVYKSGLYPNIFATHFWVRKLRQLFVVYGRYLNQPKRGPQWKAKSTCPKPVMPFPRYYAKVSAKSPHFIMRKDWLPWWPHNGNFWVRVNQPRYKTPKLKTTSISYNKGKPFDMEQFKWKKQS